MRYAFTLIAAAVVGLAGLTPAESKAGPFIYRGAWDRWVDTAYVFPGLYGYSYDYPAYYGPGTVTYYYQPVAPYVAPAAAVAGPMNGSGTVLAGATVAPTVIVPVAPPTHYYDWGSVWYGRARLWRR
jgi:hypothetical protein